jgi:uncharacterized protein with ATP-grasp and redox domains
MRNFIPPPPIRRRAGQGFADFTVTQRFPKVAVTATAALGDASGQSRAIGTLVASIIRGDRVDLNLLDRPTPFWDEYIARIDGATWVELPFFDVEFLFYHALNSIAGYFRSGIDVFHSTRRGALEAAVRSLALAPDMPKVGSVTRDDLADKLWISLLANEFDYSQLTISQSHALAWNERMVVDERPLLLNHLLRPSPGRASVHIIADNAGPELIADLVLADSLLQLGERVAVVFHCKPWPMFVSDALVGDAEQTIEQLQLHASRALSAIGQRLQRARGSARFSLEGHTAWGEPRHFDTLEENLSDSLRRAPVVIAKGDLNYRRFVGDRDWPFQSSAADASRGVPFAAFALRVLKSDALVGVKPEAASRAAETSPGWRTDGSHALVQQLGRLDPPSQ